MTEQELRLNIAELGPTERPDGTEEIGGEMQKMMRNAERMRLRIELFDLLCEKMTGQVPAMPPGYDPDVPSVTPEHEQPDRDGPLCPHYNMPRARICHPCVEWLLANVEDKMSEEFQRYHGAQCSPQTRTRST